jgi:hypothetical protein
MAITRLNNNSITSITALPSAVAVANTPYWHTRETSLQTINHGSETQATFGTEILDSDNAFASNTFTVPTGKSGIYYTWFQVDLYDADSDITNLTTIIKINDTTKSKVYTDFSNGSVPSHAHGYVSAMANLSVGDTIKYYIYMTTSNASTAQSYGGEFGTLCGGYRIIT